MGGFALRHEGGCIGGFVEDVGEALSSLVHRCEFGGKIG